MQKWQFIVLLAALVLMGITLLASFEIALRGAASQEYSVTPLPEGELVTPDTPLPETPDTPEEQVFCTMDAMQCPDGSYVGRVAPDCSFAACPQGSTTDRSPEIPAPASAQTVCTESMKTAEMCPAIYAPVCGLVEIQCVTTPCNPVPETFSNGCAACAQKNVISYSEGACLE